MRSLSHIARLAALMTTGFTICSCASYQLGPRPVEKGGSSGLAPGRPVAVETVATPAEWGLDGARLTRRLVGLLVDRGLEAEWQRAAKAARSVHCSATGSMPETLGANVSTDVSLHCRVGTAGREKPKVGTRGRAVAAAPSNPAVGIGPAMSAVMEDATIDALRRAAPRIAEHLTSPSDRLERREH